MSAYEIYTFLLCLIVYVLLSTLSVIVIITLVKMTLKMIKHGLEDDKIKEEKEKTEKKGKCTCLDKVISTIAGVLFIAVFIFSSYVNLQQNSTFEKIPTLRIVSSASMSHKHKDNKYLVENDLNNQFQTFDLIFTYKLPKEEDLKLYDIVVYEVDGMLVIHRIVGIEEPNNDHKERYFLLQGDAVERPDRFPVYYSQMRAIYRSERIPFVGSFITFMQSPAGWLCVILMIVAVVSLPIVEKKVKKATDERLAVLEELAIAEELSRVKKKEKEIERLKLLKQSAKSDTFKQKLKKNDVARLRYQQLKICLEKINQSKVIQGKTTDTYKLGNKPIAKVAVVGKTLNVYFALSPEEFKDTKYKFIDVSSKKKFKNYPMRVKITSDRQARWAGELTEIVERKLLEQNGEKNEK